MVEETGEKGETEVDRKHKSVKRVGIGGEGECVRPGHTGWKKKETKQCRGGGGGRTEGSKEGEGRVREAR